MHFCITIINGACPTISIFIVLKISLKRTQITDRQHIVCRFKYYSTYLSIRPILVDLVKYVSMPISQSDGRTNDIAWPGVNKVYLRYKPDIKQNSISYKI